MKLDKRKWALEVLARKTVSYERKTKASLGKMGSFSITDSTTLRYEANLASQFLGSDKFF